MNEKLRQQFEDQLVYLPDINQQALKSFDWATELVSIGHGFGLHIDQLEDLQIETMLVLVGLTPADDFTNEVITRLAIPPSEADKIITEVNQRVFVPIHDYIVRGGPIPAPTENTAMASAGIEMIPENPAPSMKPSSAVVPAPTSSPLQFHPTDAMTDGVPVTPLDSVEHHPSVQLSMDKLEKLYHERKKEIDATIQSMDQ